MSILKVDTINEKTTGNGVVIPSGQTLDVSAGTLVPSSGQVLQYKAGTTTSYTTHTSTSFTATNLKIDITPKSASSYFVLQVNFNNWWSTSAPAENYLKVTLYKDGTTNIFDALGYDAGAFIGNFDNRSNYDRMWSLSTTYTHGGNTSTSQEYKLYGATYLANGDTRLCGTTGQNIIHAWEIAQ
tara:strand:- start:1278 stop:1829 length:552 start_codon:yes stop_codon:yes gene_type:complete